MNKETIGVQIDFFFDYSDSGTEILRIKTARELLSSNNIAPVIIRKTIQVNGIVRVTLKANVPISVAMEHHSFDSILNKPYPDGAGAGYVAEFDGELDFTDIEA